MEALNKIERLKYTFNFPADMAEQCGYKNITLQELTPNEELTSAGRAEANPMALIQELVKQSIVAVDGKAVTTADESVDLVWVNLGQKGRSLVAAAFQSSFNAGQQELKGFLTSRTATVG